MKQKMKINLIEVRNHVKIILLMLAICTLVMSFISGIFIFEKKINEKTKKERNSPLLFLGIYNNEKRIGDDRFGTPAYCIETTVKTGRIFKINELCRKEKWVLFSLSLSGHGI
jgi:hypothetical protein